jgi:hypothetical protein
MMFAWVVGVLGLFVWATVTQSDRQRTYDAQERDRKWNQTTCLDMATLLATNSGSPSYEHCPNKHHRMTGRRWTVRPSRLKTTARSTTG